MYNVNYMEGVPVKIAEKYKPPPLLYQPSQAIANKLSLPSDYYTNCPLFSYDSQLERKALCKIEEWKRIRERNKEARRERIEKRDQQRKRQIEENQKKLLGAVSYPSTDDLSSSESDEQPEQNANGNTDIKCSEASGVTDNTLANNINSFHNILQPTVLSSCKINVDNYKLKSGNTSTINGKRDISFNYRDFEEDTSSPFDNIELKTINDLDILAQVLHNTQVMHIKDKINERENDTVETTENTANTNCIVVDDQKSQSSFNYITSEDAVNIPNQYKNEASHKINEKLNNITYDRGMVYNTGLPSYQQQYNNPIISNLKVEESESINKSKSVPDILKELSEEIRVRRTRNCSQTLETNKIESPHQIISRNNCYQQLDTSNQNLANQICAMGFPLERVARIIQLLGANGKKIIEHLIPLNELCDLGFDECKISEALLRNENNKEKALDDLIS